MNTYSRIIQFFFSVLVLRLSFFNELMLYSEEFIFKNEISYHSYPRERPDTGARLIKGTIVGNHVVFVIETGYMAERTLDRQHAICMGILNIDSGEIRFVEIKRDENERQTEFGSIDPENDHMMTFSTHWRDMRENYADDRTAKLYRMNLTNSEIAEVKSNSSNTSNHNPRIPGFFLSQESDRVISVTDRKTGQSFPIRTDYFMVPSSNYIDASIGKRSVSYLSSGNESFQLLVVDCPYDVIKKSQVSGYDLRTQERKVIFAGTDIEKKLGFECRGMQPVANMRYPLDRLLIVTFFKGRPPVCAIIDEGKIEWMIQLDKKHKWKSALTSENERYLAIRTETDAFHYHLFLADCEQQKILPPLDLEYPRLQKYRGDEMIGVTNDERLVLSGEDITIARYDKRWEFEVIKVLKPAVKQESEK